MITIFPAENNIEIAQHVRPAEIDIRDRGAVDFQLSPALQIGDGSRGLEMSDRESRRRSFSRGGLKLFLVFTAIAIFISTSMPTMASDKIMIDVDQIGEATDKTRNPLSDTRGRDLRRAIDAEYARRRSAHALKVSGTGVNDISDLIRSYIKAGDSIADAEAVLRAAGFEIGGRGPGYDGTMRDLAKIRNYIPIIFGGAITIIVRILPTDDWLRVHEIDGGISIEWI